jgi:hypothetical protein
VEASLRLAHARVHFDIATALETFAPSGSPVV